MNADLEKDTCLPLLSGLIRVDPRTPSAEIRGPFFLPTLNLARGAAGDFFFGRLVLAQPFNQLWQQLGELRLPRLTDNRNRDHALSV